MAFSTQRLSVLTQERLGARGRIAADLDERQQLDGIGARRER